MNPPLTCINQSAPSQSAPSLSASYSASVGAVAYHKPVEERGSDSRPGAEDAELGVLHANSQLLSSADMSLLYRRSATLDAVDCTSPDAAVLVTQTYNSFTATCKCKSTSTACRLLSRENGWLKGPPDLLQWLPRIRRPAGYVAPDQAEFPADTSTYPYVQYLEHCAAERLDIHSCIGCVMRQSCDMLSSSPECCLTPLRMIAVSRCSHTCNFP